MGKASGKKRGDRPSKGQLKAIARRRQQRQVLAYALGGIAVVALAGVLLFTGGGGGGSSGETKPSAAADVHVSSGPLPAPLAEGDRVPDFSAPAIGGGTVSWSDYAGKPTVLSVWAPWCPHCQVELPRLGQISKEFPGVQVVTVATSLGDQPGPDATQFLKDNSLTFPTAIDTGDETLMKALGVQGFPTIYFVKADGTVMFQGEGEVSSDDLRQLFQAVQQP